MSPGKYAGCQHDESSGTKDSRRDTRISAISRRYSRRHSARAVRSHEPFSMSRRSGRWCRGTSCASSERCCQRGRECGLEHRCGRLY